jgi:hypothetical protein
MLLVPSCDLMTVFHGSSWDTHEFQKVDRHQLDISSPALSKKHGELGSHQLNGKRDKQR